MTCKTCTKCGDSKPLDEFYAHPHCAHGRQSLCKLCQNIINHERNLRIKAETGMWEQQASRAAARAKWAAIAAENAAP